MAANEAHVRIDEGIKRGKKIQRRPGPGKLRRNEDGQVQAIPPELNPAEVLERYLSEQTTSQIAASYGVRRKSLVAWLRKVAPKQWREVQLTRAHDRKDVGNEGIEDAPDALSLARARELVRSAHLDLAALDPDYRPKQDVQHTIHPPTLQITVVQQPGVVIDVTPEKPLESVEAPKLASE